MTSHPSYRRLATLGLLVPIVMWSGFFPACPTTHAMEYDFERAPIDYHHAPSTDRIAQLAQQLQQGKAKLAWDEHYGWLPSILQALDVAPESQTLVFSKTSLQLRKISPATPRALYFSDDVYVGWVQHGEVVELSAVDRELGAVFYTLSQRNTPQPSIIRDQGECLSCHASPKTQGVPGYLVRSVFTAADGQPLLSLGSTTSDHRTPLRDRFGGWYVTGTHGKLRHRGNVLARENEDPPIQADQGANCLDLSRFCDVSPYLRQDSDMVALMVLEHQSQMHNALTQAHYVTRQAIHYDDIMNRALGRDVTYRSDSTQRRIKAAAESLVEHLLFAEQAEWSEPIVAGTDFVQSFQRHAVKDSQGRSFRDLDLQRRLFKYPCSFLIYSDAFTHMPEPILAHVRQRLVEILRRGDASPKFQHLSSADRTAIDAMLQETMPGLLP